MDQRDRNFLREYHFFTAGHIPSVASVVATRMREVRLRLGDATAPDDNIRLGDELGHLLAHLYMLNFMQVDAICALLYGLANPTGGVLRALLSFDLRQHSEFVDSLRDERVSLTDIGIRVPDDLQASSEYAQACAQLAEHLRRFATILRDDNLRRTYNKLKHGAVVVRRPEFMWDETDAAGLETNAVFIPTTRCMTTPHATRLPLSPEDGSVPEEQYLANIQYIGRIAAAFAKAAALSDDQEDGEQHCGQISSEGAPGAPPNESSPFAQKRRKPMYKTGSVVRLALALTLSATLALAALLKCPDCGHMVSSRANSCPQCGCPVATMQSGEETVPTVASPATFNSVRNALVLIKTKHGVGSGFVTRMGEFLYVLTNAHVLHDADDLSLKTLGGVELGWSTIELADDIDLARVKLQSPPEGVQPLKLSTAKLDMNQPVLVYGNSQGSGVATELKGKILGVGPKTLETDAEFVHGNSGSPILNSSGEVIGVATYVTRTSPGADWVADNTRFTQARRFGVRMSDVRWVTVEPNVLAAQVGLLRDIDEFFADAFSLIPNWLPAVAAEYRYAARDALHTYSAKRRVENYTDATWPQLVERFCDLYVAAADHERSTPRAGRLSTRSFEYQSALRKYEGRKAELVALRDKLLLSLHETPTAALARTKWSTSFLETEAKARQDTIVFLKECVETARESTTWGRAIGSYHGSRRTPDIATKD